MNSQDWDTRYEKKELVWSAGPNQFVVAELGKMAPNSALDVGCGEGRNALWLAERGFTVTAMDFSPVAIEKGRARSAELALSVDWRVGDATKDISGNYDLILYAYLHLSPEQMATSLTLACESLAAGGTLLLIGHDLRNIEEGIGGPQDPQLLQSPESLRVLLSGLHIEFAETRKRRVNKNGQVRDALDVVVRAKQEA